MTRRWIVPSLLLLVTMSLFTAQACGPDFSVDVFVRKLRPDNPKEFAAGKLGVLLPTYPRADLTVAFRYLNGGVLSPAEQQAYHPMDSYYSEEEWAAKWQREEAEQKKVVDPAESWRIARAKFASPEPKVEQDRELKIARPDGSTFAPDYLNCHANAFRTAVLTLESRAKAWGEKSPDLTNWLAGQDAVFANCRGGAATMPTDVPAGSSALLKTDRQYQLAAAQFYAAQFEPARKSFLAIAEDSNSPWRGIARYLAARCLVRQAFLSPRSDQGDTMASFDPVLMQQAAVMLRELLKEKPTGVSQQTIQSELDLVRLRTEPSVRLKELAVALAGPKADSGYDQHLKDLTWYLDAQLDQTALREDFADGTQPTPDKFSKSYLDFAALRSSSELVDWLLTFQSPSDGARKHAIDEWTKTHRLDWLVAAMTKATEKDSEATALLTAAEQVKPGSPAWESLTYHRVRLLIAMGRGQEARTALDQAMASVRTGGRDSSVSAFLGLKMRAAVNMNEFLASAPRKLLESASESQYALTECLDVMKNPRRVYDCKKEVNPIQFSEDAASFFNTEAPLPTLIEAAKSEALPEQLRRVVAMMAWVRSVLLKDDGAAAELLPLMPDKLRQQAGSGTGFHAVMTIVRNPGLRPYLDAGVQRSYSYDFVESYRDNWWNQDWGAGDYGYYATPLKKISVSFLTPAQRSEGEQETSTLMKQGGAKIHLGELVLDYAKNHSADPDVPESLYLVLRMMRYGSWSSRADDPAGKILAGKEETISKGVSRLLRQRYVASPWTKKSAPFAE
jgi:hypothetical protein